MTMHSTSDENRYQFVTRIGNGKITRSELDALRHLAIPGSHIDLILQESLYDDDYDPGTLSECAAVIPDDAYIMTSFPRSELSHHNLLFRSEFLFLRNFGDGHVNLELDRRRHIEMTLDIIEQAQPKSLIYRLCDYNNEDFSFLSGYPDFSSRGAQRLIEQNALLDLDIAILKAILDHGTQVSVLVPCVQFPLQFDAIHQSIQGSLGDHPYYLGTGVMLELPINLCQVSDYHNADFYIFGPGDLLKFFYGGIDRNHPLFINTDIDALSPVIRHCIERLADSRPDAEVYLAKSLIPRQNVLFHDYSDKVQVKHLYLPRQLMEIYQV